MQFRSPLFASLIVLAMATLTAAENPGEPAYASKVPEPTLRGVAYGEHERQTLDLWKADSENPTPLVVVIHGGGWVGGSKERVDRFVEVSGLLEAGISVAAINYRLLPWAEEAGVEPPVSAPLEDAARSIQYIRSRAREWNIDKQRIAAAGGSAGACSSLWLAFHDDLADTESPDPIARESTRLWCAAVTGAQTTLDPHQMREWTPNSRYGGRGFGFPKFEEFHAARDSILPWIEAYSPYHQVSDDDPPVFLRYGGPPLMGREQRDPTHTANFGLGLLKLCQERGVECELAFPNSPHSSHADTTSFLIETLSN
ncbi:MAG: alpha/beta hydrolase [Verrucomicrobiota bacterium]